MTDQPIAANAHARRMAAAQEARDTARAELLAQKADVTTPLPVATPAAEPAKPARTVVLSYTVIYRGRSITINAEGMSLDAFCDMLDARLGVAG